MKKRILILLACVVVLATGCAQTAYRGNKNFDTQYREWVEGIGILDKKHGKMTHLNEEDNTVELGVLCEDTKSYEDLCSVVNAHNDFVENDPGYFSSDAQISIAGTLASWETVIRFFNGDCKYFNLDSYKGTLDMKDTSKMQFAFLDLKGIPKRLYEMNSKFEVPIVILRYDNPTVPGDDAYKILEKFAAPEQVMIEFLGMEYDPEQVAESIRKHAPGVRVFDDTRGKYID